MPEAGAPAVAGRCGSVAWPSPAEFETANIVFSWVLTLGALELYLGEAPRTDACEPRQRGKQTTQGLAAAA